MNNPNRLDETVNLSGVLKGSRVFVKHQPGLSFTLPLFGGGLVQQVALGNN